MRVRIFGLRGQRARQSFERRGQIATPQMTQPFDLQAFGIVRVRGERAADLGERFVGSAELQEKAGATPLGDEKLEIAHGTSVARISHGSREVL